MVVGDVTVIERAVEDHAGEQVAVRAEPGGGEVSVRWPCGDVVRLDVERLDAALSDVSMLEGTGAWVQHVDSVGLRFQTLRDGDDLAVRMAVGREVRRVPWRPLRRVLEDAVDAHVAAQAAEKGDGGDGESAGDGEPATGAPAA
jgi:hypothetical protein